MRSLVNEGLIFAPEGVWEEIQHNASADLRRWAKNNYGMFQPHDIPLQTEANLLQAKYPGLIDPYAVHDEADRYIIALAKLRKLAVVTHETSARAKKRPPRSHYIPDVCAEESIRCLTFVDLMREQKWAF